jgi:membrane protein DedA with SNARE-associated domain
MTDILTLTFGFIEWANAFVIAWGYLGLFIVEIIGSMSIIFPAPAFAVNFFLGGVPGFNPWLVGIVAGLGSSIGEMTSYLVGRGGREVIEEKYRKKLKRAREWVEKRGAFLVIIIFAATPLPFDIVGILAGMSRYDFKRFFIATLIGKIIAGLALAWAGYYSVNWLLEVFDPSISGQNVTGAFTGI